MALMNWFRNQAEEYYKKLSFVFLLLFILSFVVHFLAFLYHFWCFAVEQQLVQNNNTIFRRKVQTELKLERTRIREF